MKLYLSYCGNCRNLSVTELEQTDKKEPHICLRYNKRVYHYTEHPNIVRLDICVIEESKQPRLKNKIWNSEPRSPENCKSTK